MIRALGYDPSLTGFGWCLVEAETPWSPILRIDSGRWKTTNKTLFVDRYTHLKQQIAEQLERLAPDYIGCESPIFGETQSSQMYALFIQVNQAIRDYGRDVMFITPTRLKAQAREAAAFPDKWTMDKPDMIRAAKLLMGNVPRSLSADEADAYHVARAGLRFLSFLEYDSFFPEGLLSPVERQQYLEVHTYTRGKKAGKTEYRGLAYKDGSRYYTYSRKEY